MSEGEGSHGGTRGQTNRLAPMRHFCKEVNFGLFGSVIPWLRAASRSDLLKLNVHFSLDLPSYLLTLAYREPFSPGF